MRQSIWQRVSGNCNLMVYTWSEGMKRHIIPALPIDEVCKLMGISKPNKTILSDRKELAYGIEEEI